MDLGQLFKELNELHFDGFLEAPPLSWNARLRASAGRFFPGRRRWLDVAPPRIEIASYLLEEKEAASLVRDTLGHEMIHYWLWVMGRPYGHTDEFRAKMKEMGVSRYNPVPRTRPPRHLYECPGCRGRFPARRKLGTLACALCCREHAGGRYDARFKLVRLEEMPGEPPSDSVS